jgi:DNA-binding NarL/FixJ family response regulator
MSKIPSQENSTFTQDQVEEKLEEELFPETVAILLESETKEDLNSMISSLQKGGTEVPHVSDDTYKKLRKRRNNEASRENMRKRAAGEDVPTCATGAPPVKLSASQRAVNGKRSCLAPNCPKAIEFF